MDPLLILDWIARAAQTTVDATTAWKTVAAMVAEQRNPSDAEWALADAAADAAHAAVQGAATAPP